MGLALSLCLILLAACSGSALGPDPFGPGRDPSGTADGRGAPVVLIGTWRTVLVIQVPDDLQTWTTTIYRTSAGEMTFTFAGGGNLTFDFLFAAFSPDRLVLDGFEYERLA
jgi:hypothetical protein